MGKWAFTYFMLQNTITQLIKLLMLKMRLSLFDIIIHNNRNFNLYLNNFY